MNQLMRIRRNAKAVTIIEMIVGTMVIIPVVLTLIDLALITLAVQINDNAAREADRVAAAGAPSSAASRVNRVLAGIQANTGGFISQITLSSISFNPTNLAATEASFIPYGGMLQGTVTVNTQVTVTPLAVPCVYTGPLMFMSSQTCPITYTVPNTAGGVAVPP